MTEISLKAMAKINLGLDVLSRREDGYHEVKMIMQTVDLYDTLTLIQTATPEITVQVDVETLPIDENNLIYKAAKLMYENFSIPGGIKIILNKNIPIAAGMAGGSTDAAATMVGMNRLFQLGVQEEELKRLAVTIGADVPYCISGGTYLSEGIGEKLTKLPDAPPCYLVIAKPDINVSTKFVYENLHVEKIEQHPQIDQMVQAIQAQDVAAVAGLMENVLETVTIKAYPVIEEIKQLLKENGALNALMSGSGPTVFALFTEEDRAQSAKIVLEKAGLAKQIFVTKLINQTCIEKNSN